MLKLDLCHVDEKFWTSSVSGVKSSTAGTLLIKHNVVQWRNESNNCILKQFSCESTPLAAVFFPFQARVYSNDPVVAILVTSNLIRFHTIEGQIYELVLNFIAKNIYPSALGLLVERESLALSRQIYSPNDQQHFMYSVTCPDGPIRPIHSVSEERRSAPASTAGPAPASGPWSSFTESMEHDCKHIVCVWDRFVCVFEEETGALAIHALQAVDRSHELLALRTPAHVVGGAGGGRGASRLHNLLGDSTASFVSSHSSDSSPSLRRSSGLSDPLSGQSELNLSDHSSLSGRSNSTGYSSLRRRPKKLARAGSGGGAGSSHALAHSHSHSLASPRSTSPVSFMHSLPFPSFPSSQALGQQETSLLSDSLYSNGDEGHGQGDGDFLPGHTQHLPTPPVSNDNLPAEMQLSPSLALIQLGVLSTLNSTDDEGKDSQGQLFFIHFTLSFSVSPVGTILMHLLSRQTHDLRTYAFFPELDVAGARASPAARQQQQQRPGDPNVVSLSSRLKLLCTRPSVRSVTHIYLGKQKRFSFSKCGSGSHSKKVSSARNRDRDRDIFNESMREAYRGASLTNNFNDFIGTLFLSTEVGRWVVVCSQLHEAGRGGDSSPRSLVWSGVPHHAVLCCVVLCCDVLCCTGMPCIVMGVI